MPRLSLKETQHITTNREVNMSTSPTIDELIGHMDEFTASKARLLVETARSAFARKGLPFPSAHSQEESDVPRSKFPLPFAAAFTKGIELELWITAPSDDRGEASASLQMTIIDPKRRSEPTNLDSAHLGITWHAGRADWIVHGIDELSPSLDSTSDDADVIKSIINDMYRVIPPGTWDEDGDPNCLLDEDARHIAIALLEFYLRD